MMDLTILGRKEADHLTKFLTFSIADVIFPLRKSNNPSRKSSSSIVSNSSLIAPRSLATSLDCTGLAIGLVLSVPFLVISVPLI